jgi:uncharacterized protein YoxC
MCSFSTVSISATAEAARHPGTSWGSATDPSAQPPTVPCVLSALHMLAKADASDVIAAVAAAIALGSLVVAVLAIGKAGKANELSAKANEIAGGAKELSAEANTIAREANTLSGTANNIAGDARDLVARSVELDEVAHAEREQARAARAVLTAALEPAELRSQGSAGYFPVALIVSNTGERDAGRTEVEVQIPEFASTNQVCWEDQQHDRNRVRSRPVAGAKMGANDQWNGCPSSARSRTCPPACRPPRG